MKKTISKRFRLEGSSGRFLLLVVSVLWLAVFLPALAPAADIPESNPADATDSGTRTGTDAQSSPGPAGNDDQKLTEWEQLEILSPRRNRASYPIVTTESQSALRSMKRARSDVDRSMRSLNDSLRRANSAIYRTRSLNKKF